MSFMKVLKFGGSSISSPDSLNNVLTIASKYSGKGDTVIIVVSALFGVTDKLNLLIKLLKQGDHNYIMVFQHILEVHNSLAREVFNKSDLRIFQENILPFEKELEDFNSKLLFRGTVTNKDGDNILSYGELFSATLISHFLNTHSFGVDFLDARKLIFTNNNYGNASARKKVTTKNIRDYLRNNPGNKVVTGFIATTTDGSTTTLGRGGSDYTAALFGLATNAKSITKWTDVNGIMTADPKLVENAYSMNRISYRMLLNLCKYSSKVVVHRKAIIPLAKKGLPFIIRNTLNKGFVGTIVDNSDDEGSKVISVVDNCCQIKVNKNKVLTRELKAVLKNVSKLSSVVMENGESYQSYIVPKSAMARIALIGNYILQDNVDLVLITLSCTNGQKHNILRDIVLMMADQCIEVVVKKYNKYSVSIAVLQAQKHLAICTLHKEFMAPECQLDKKPLFPQDYILEQKNGHVDMAKPS